MVFRSRGENVQLADTVHLRAQFKDTSGTPTDLDSFPHISIVQPSGNVSLAPTSVGITRISAGLYQYDYAVGINGPMGVYTDTWTGIINGFNVEASFNFVVETTQIPAINTDGYFHIGDSIGFNYSQTAIFNINKLVKSLKARLNSSGKSKKTDSYGNVIYEDCDIFSTEMLVSFLSIALTEFNAIPYFTNFTFEDTSILDQFHVMFVEGATLYALASKALIERGREFQISDNGINFTPPTVSDLLNTQYSALLASYNDRLRFIKNSMRPAALGLGTLSISTGRNPAIARLRHLRARRYY